MVKIAGLVHAPGMANQGDKTDQMPDSGWPVPPGVDPGLWAEFEHLAARLQELHRLGGDGPGSPRRRIMIELPEEWIMLFAWIDTRERQRRKGRSGPTGCTPEAMEAHGLSRVARSIRPWLHHLLYETFHTEWHGLTGAKHYLYRDMDMEAEAVRKAALDASMEKFKATGDPNDLPF